MYYQILDHIFGLLSLLYASGRQLTCSTPWLVNIFRDTLVMANILIGEGEDTLKPFFCVATLIFTERVSFLFTLGTRLLHNQTIGSKREALGGGESSKNYFQVSLNNDFCYIIGIKRVITDKV